MGGKETDLNRFYVISFAIKRAKMIEWPAISFIIFWDFSMFYKIFFSPQVKRWVIITYKHGIYELPHELPNDLRLRILGN